MLHSCKNYILVWIFSILSSDNLPTTSDKQETLQEVAPSDTIRQKESVAEEPPITQPRVETSTIIEKRQIPKQIFVAHGKNKKPIEQLEKILNKFKVPYKVAIDEPHRGRPISAKVAELMKNCTSGIFIFTADEETQDLRGE